MPTYLQRQSKCPPLLVDLARSQCDAAADPEQAERLAQQLLAFLTTKRDLLASGVQLDMSPSWQLDGLWRALLLDTSVRDQVAAQLGCSVPRSAAEDTLPDDVKLQRRLVAMNLMAVEGYDVHVPFWTEPGTAMHTLVWVWSRPGSALPGVFLAACMSGAQMIRFTCDLMMKLGLADLALVRSLPSAAAAQLHLQLQAPVDALRTPDITSAAARHVHACWQEGADEAAQLQLLLQQQQQNLLQPCAAMLLVVRLLTGQQVTLACSPDWNVFMVKAAVQEAKGVPLDQQLMVYEGRELEDGRTLANCNVPHRELVLLPAACGAAAACAGGWLAQRWVTCRPAIPPRRLASQGSRTWDRAPRTGALTASGAA
jgi:hypothetical protein